MYWVFLLCLFLVSETLSGDTTSFEIVKNDHILHIATMSENLNLLNNGKSYVFFNLRFSDREMEIFEKLKIEEFDALNLCGKLDPIFEEVPAFLKSIGNDDEEVIRTITDAVYRIAVAITHAAGKEGAWVALRARLPIDDYDIPRWHTDGYYFPPF
jgi:hypothetical protein